ncbi:RNA-directed DNA polymerase, eukaryota, reverse transcriptase zinc-binding domain protein [Tanacetum coccineum]
MRSKRTTKILLKIDDSVHSINNSKTNNKKNVSKNNGCSAENKFVECDDNKEGGECNMPGNTAEKECLMEYGSCDSNVGGKNISVESEKGNVTGEFNANGMEQCHENKSTMYTGVGGSGMKGMDTDKKPFVAAISKSLIDNDRNLECIPTEIDENGIKVVVFDDVMLAEGSKRWHLTLCGFFVGYKMSINELRYNLRRMWSRYGFIIDYNNGVFFMKFPYEEGLNQVVNSVLWMVNRKPLEVQKWSIDLKLDSTKLDKVPLWVRLCFLWKLGL